MYKNKYLKYKKKYLELKNIKIGGNNNDIINNNNNNNIEIFDEYKNISKKEYFELMEYGFENGYYWSDVPKYFIKGCDELEIKLNEIKNEKKAKKLYILCPGDSSYKIVKYFEKLSLCKFCEFAIFPFSRPYKNEYNPETTFRYLKKYIPDDYSNLVILDSVYFGTTIKMILDSMIIKNQQNKTQEYYENNNKIINKIYETCGIFDDEKKKIIPDNNYIIDLYRYMSAPYLEDYLFVSEMHGIRCVPEFREHDHENINLLDHDKTGCDYFIKMMILSKLYYNWYNEYLKSKKDNSSYDDNKNFII